MKNRVLRFEQEVFEWLLNGVGWEAVKRGWNAIRSRMQKRPTTEIQIHETGRIHFEVHLDETVSIGGSPFVLDDPVGDSSEAGTEPMSPPTQRTSP